MSNETPEQNRITRRKFLRTSAAAAVVAVVAGVGGYLAYQSSQPSPVTQRPAITQQPATQAPATQAPATPTQPTVAVPATDISFVIWTWGVELVQDHVNKFNAAHPEIRVGLSDIAQETYREGIIAKFTGGAPMDLLYSSTEWQREWEDAGWVVPTEDYFPEIRKYLDDIAPGFRPGVMSKDGKMLGLLYYGDNTNFVFNKKHLDQINSPVPKTWDEVRSTAVALKNNKVTEIPMAAFLGSYGFWQTIYTFIVGISKPIDKEGIHYLFTEDLQPVMEKDSPIFTALRWLIDVINVDKTFAPASINYGDPDIINNTGSGIHSLTWMPTYDLGPTNDPSQKEFGNIKHAINPGTGVASAWMRPYNITKKLADKGSKALEAAWKLQVFFGGKTDDNFNPVANPATEGKYRVNTRIFTDVAVPTPYKSLLLEPEYRATYSKWGDPEIALKQLETVHVHQVDGEIVPWWGEWSGGWGLGFARVELNGLLLGQRGTADSDILAVLKKIEEKWNSLKAGYK